jgi:hypothetical protein
VRPDGEPFFNQNALLFSPVADLRQTMKTLYQARPFLMALASNPSLRGTVKAVSFINQGAHEKAGTLDDFDRPMALLGDVFEGVLLSEQPALLLSGEHDARAVPCRAGMVGLVARVSCHRRQRLVFNRSRFRERASRSDSE